MKRLVLKLTVLVLTFCFGIGFSTVWRAYANRISAQQRLRAGVPSGLPLQLLYVDACGGSSYSQSYQLADGSQISVNCFYFSTEAAADAMLKEAGASGSEIVESSENLDEFGHRIGRTIVVAGPTVVRYSIYGKSFCKTRASSLEALRDFEGRH